MDMDVRPSTTITVSTTTTTTIASSSSASPPPISSVPRHRLDNKTSRSSSPSTRAAYHHPYSSSPLWARQYSQPPPSFRSGNSTSSTARTESHSGQRASKKRSPNRIRARPADPAVISGILSSLETFPPQADLGPQPQAHFFESADGQPRPYSPPGSTVATAPTVPRGTNFASPLANLLRTANYDNGYRRPSYDNNSFSFQDFDSVVKHTHSGQGEEVDENESEIEDDEDDDAAAPPVVPTSRSPSGLSNYLAPLPPSFVGNTGSAGQPRRQRSTDSRTSIGSTKQDRDTRSNKKLSAESWVKPTSRYDRERDKDRSPLGNGQTSMRRHPRELRRINSQETLRPDTSGSGHVNGGLRTEYIKGEMRDGFLMNGINANNGLSRAEEIIARTPPAKASSKGRLFLGDTTIDERQLALDSPGSVITYPEIVPSPKLHSFPRSPPENSASPSDSSKKSPQRTANAIVDSIPIRTSSLRQPSQSPVSLRKKKERRSRKTADEKPKKLSWSGSKKVNIPESTWADLGDDDETVKRIRELRAKRKERLRESLALASPDESPLISTNLKSLISPTYEVKTPSDVDSERPFSAGDSQRGATPPSFSGFRREIPGSASSHAPEVTSGGIAGLTHFKAEPSPIERPMTAATQPSAFNSNIPLDYSYTEAMYVLQNILANPVDQTDPTSQIADAMDLKAMDLNADDDPSEVRSAPNSPQRVKRDSRPPPARWSTHPDLPSDYDRRGKGRRKSMGDARNGRPFEDDLNPGRRDSIDAEVMEFLCAPRLSQTVRHPLTGRIISFSEVGDPQGAAVLICLGMGLTRYVTAFFDELAVTLRLRLITIERPGVGASEAYPPSDHSGPLSWPDDVLAVCQHLGVGKFSLLAHSAGAIYALATSLILPHLIRGKVQLLAPWIPPSQLESVSHPTSSAIPGGALPRSQRLLRVLPAPFLKAANSSFMTATSASLKPVNKRGAKTGSSKAQTREDTQRRERAPYSDKSHHRESLMAMDQFMPGTNPMENFLKLSLPDGANADPDGLSTSPSKQGLFLSATATPTDPNFAFASIGLNAAEHEARERKVEYTARLTQRTWDLATRDSNPATDLLVCLERHREVGFRYTDVLRDMAITNGSEDKRVPVANIRWLADQMNRRGAHGTSDDLSNGIRCEVKVLEGEGHGLMASPLIMGDILTEIAGSWIGEDNGR